jgi:hypothetical protein
MTDILLIAGALLGVVFLIIGIQKVKFKLFKLIGIVLILVSLIFIAPDFIRGFKEGFAAAIN